MKKPENEKTKLSAVELIERLIEDINKSSIIRLIISDPISEFEMNKYNEEIGLVTVFTSLNVSEFNTYLSKLSQFINWEEKLVDYNEGDKIEISVFQKDISLNREKIVIIFQQLIDSEELFDSETQRPISELLIECLDGLNNASE